MNTPLCLHCRWLHAVGDTPEPTDPPTCRAFPDGIPEPILADQVEHDRPYPGDREIRFEPARRDTLRRRRPSRVGKPVG